MEKHFFQDLHAPLNKDHPSLEERRTGEEGALVTGQVACALPTALEALKRKEQRPPSAKGPTNKEVCVSLPFGSHRGGHRGAEGAAT